MQQVIINLKVSKEVYMGKFIVQKGKRENMKLFYNFQRKENDNFQSCRQQAVNPTPHPQCFRNPEYYLLLMLLLYNSATARIIGRSFPPSIKEYEFHKESVTPIYNKGQKLHRCNKCLQVHSLWEDSFLTSRGGHHTGCCHLDAVSSIYPLPGRHLQ